MDTAAQGSFPASPRRPGSGQGSLGLVAALLLLVVAAANPSLIGLLFLVAFFMWGAYYLPLAGHPRLGPQAAKALWGAVSALASAVVLLQLCFQLALAAGLVPGMRRRAVLATLRLVGVPLAESGLELLGLLVPPLLALLAAALQVAGARRQEMRRAQEEAEGVELRAIAGHRGGADWGRLMLLLPGYSNSGVLAAVALLTVTLTNPTLLVLPHAVALLGTIWRWAGGRQAAGAHSASWRGLQIYTGLLLGLQYSWQVGLHKVARLSFPARILGLARLSDDQPAAEFMPELAQLLGLLLLFACMGLSRSGTPRPARSGSAREATPLLSDGTSAATAGASAMPSPADQFASSPELAWTGTSLLSRLLTLTSAQQAQRSRARQQGVGGGVSSWDGWDDDWTSPEDAPLLSFDGNAPSAADQPGPAYRAVPAGIASSTAASAPASAEPGGSRAPPRPMAVPQPETGALRQARPTAGSPGAPQGQVSVKAVMLPLLCELAVACFELLTARPACVAAMLCACALIEPSVIGGTVLLVGLAVQLSRTHAAAPVLQRYSRLLCVALLLWVLGCFFASSVAPALGSNQVLEAVGVHSFQGARAKGVAGAPFLALLLTAAAAAGLARAGSVAGAGGAGRGAAQLERIVSMLYPRPRHVSRRRSMGTTASIGAAGGGLASGSPRAALSPRPSPSPALFASTPLSGGSVVSPNAPAGSPADANAADMAGRRAWVLLWRSLLRMLWYAGFLAVPAAQLAVGSTSYDALHGAYWAGLLLQLAVATLHLKPSLANAVVARPVHRVLRSYTSLHLLAVYVAYVGGLPGFGEGLQPGSAEPALRAVGLWHPRVALGMLPLLGLLLLATLHAHIGRALEEHQRGSSTDQYLARVSSVASWHPTWLIMAARLAVAYGPGAVALLGYSLLLLDCPVGFLGLAYLLALVAVLLRQPFRGHWASQGAGAANALHAAMEGRHDPPAGSPSWGAFWLAGSGGALRWIPLFLLASLATVDFTAQALLPGATAVLERYCADDSWWRDVLDFLTKVVGLDNQAHGLGLALRLLRPLALLCALCLYRSLYCLGTLHSQLKHEARDPAVLQRKRMAAQFGLWALFKRFLVLHAFKLVSLSCFGAAMQTPGAFGWLLVAGAVAAAPVLGAVQTGTVYRRASLKAFLSGAEAVGAAWLVAQYAVEVWWVRDFLTSLDPNAANWLEWAGLRLTATTGARVVERVLRCKALLLVAVAVKRRTFRWYKKLPQDVKASSCCGAPCPLFWPPSAHHPSTSALLEERAEGGMNSLLSLGGQAGGVLSPHGGGAQPSLLQSLRLAMQDLRRRVGELLRLALRAMDWPEPAKRAGSSRVARKAAGYPTGSGDSGHVLPLPRAVPTSQAVQSGQGRHSVQPDLVSAEAQAFRFAAQEWVERYWQGWGIDTSLFLLLLAAFFAGNALSLMYLAFIAAGMACGTATRQRIWRYVVLPLLALVVVGQYSVLLGLPPIRLGPSSFDLDQDMVDWLGFGTVSKAAVWMLFVAFAASAMQVHYERWLACSQKASRRPSARAPPQQAQQGQQARQRRRPSRAGSFDGIDSPHAALLGRQHHFSASGASSGAGSDDDVSMTHNESARLAKEPQQEHSTHEFLALDVGPVDRGAGGGGGTYAVPPPPRPLPAVPAGAESSSGLAGPSGGAAGPSVDALPAPPALPPLHLPTRDTDGGGASSEAISGANGNHTSSVHEQAGLDLWRPMAYDQQHTWRWIDWARYYIFRHYLDVVLVAVVALCTLENDIIHAGYLAIALFFFRGRIHLRTQRNRLFWWLPFFNFVVMLVTLIYQAPFEEVFDWKIDPEKACSLAHLLGLYKLRGSAAILSLSYRGALADVVLWAVIRGQTRLFDSPTYAKAVEVVQQEEASEKESLEWETGWWVDSQAKGAVEESRQRHARALRVERLKAGVARGFSSSQGVDPSMFDKAFLSTGAGAARHPKPQQAQQAQRSSSPPHGRASPESDQGGGGGHPQLPSEGGADLRRRRPQSVGGGNGEVDPSGKSSGNGSTAGPGGGASTANLLTDYEREILEAEQPQQARHAGEHSADSGGGPDVAAMGRVVTEQSRNWGSRAWRWLQRRLRRVDRESYLCYTAFLLAFAADYSLLLSFYPLSILLYSLVSIRPSRAYWQVALVLSEAIIIAQYAYLVPTRLGCHFISPDIVRSLEVVGLHTTVARCLPLFLVYLATLMHTYGLATRHAPRSVWPGGVSSTAPVNVGGTTAGTPPPPAAAAGGTGGEGSGTAAATRVRSRADTSEGPAPKLALDIEQGGGDGHGGSPEQQPGPGDGTDPVAALQGFGTGRLGSGAGALLSGPAMDAGQHSVHSSRPSSDAAGGVEQGGDDLHHAEHEAGLAGRISRWSSRLGQGAIQGSTAFWEFLCRACTVSERAPHFVLVSLRLPASLAQLGSTGPAGAAGSPDRAAAESAEAAGLRWLEEKLQRVLDSYREADIEAARESQDRKRRAALGLHNGGDTDDEEGGEERQGEGDPPDDVPNLTFQAAAGLVAPPANLIDIDTQQQREAPYGAAPMAGVPPHATDLPEPGGDLAGQQAQQREAEEEDGEEGGEQEEGVGVYGADAADDESAEGSRTAEHRAQQAQQSKHSGGADQQGGQQLGEGAGSGPAVPAEDLPGEAIAGGGVPGTSYPDLSRMGPLQLRLQQVVSQSAGGGEVSLLFEVVPVKSTPANSHDWCRVAGWPLRSLNPGRDAAATLLRHKCDPAAAEHAGGGGNPAGSEGEGVAGEGWEGVEVVSAEHHSRQAQDWYAATAAVDFLAFIYVALFYQNVVSSARSLTEITNEHVVPLGYLLTLILLFMLIVMDRVAYTVGSPLGKALLHVSQLALYFGYCLSLFWSPLTSSGARAHLRALIIIKCASFVLSALQLRTGYPPPASYRNGMGRHSFVFMRHVSTLNGLAFQVFAAVPFLYELRELLDWSCTPTTLPLGDWLKLEDINNSLFLVTCDRKARAQKAPGARQPRYLKFFQGTLLFAGLLLLLWVPLLVFSSGNPTYQIPQILSFHVNMTISSDGSGSSGSSRLQGPEPPNTRLLGGTGGAGSASSGSSSMRRARALEGSSGGTASGTAGGKSSTSGSTAVARSALQFPLFVAGDRRASGEWSNADNGTLPAGLDDYDPSQIQLLCIAKDADQFWQLSPPARDTLEAALGKQDKAASITFGWSVERDNPPPSGSGGPMCQGAVRINLAGSSRQALLAMLRGQQPHAELLRYNASDPGSQGPGGRGSRGLYPLLWLLRGDVCAARALQSNEIGKIGGASKRRLPSDYSWADQWVACNASLHSQADNASQADALALAAAGGGSWWTLKCGLVDSSDNPIEAQEEQASCGEGYQGPRMVAMLERVQTGVIGRALSSYGIAGLYTVFVYGIGRFLRLSVSNLRMRIPFEDLPNTRRLVALCQDIYIARAEGELGLEEELYWTLINVYRLPSLMFELTKKER